MELTNGAKASRAGYKDNQLLEKGYTQALDEDAAMAAGGKVRTHYIFTSFRHRLQDENL